MEVPRSRLYHLPTLVIVRRSEWLDVRTSRDLVFMVPTYLFLQSFSESEVSTTPPVWQYTSGNPQDLR